MTYLHIDRAQRIPNSGIGVLVKRVQIESHGCGKYNRILGNDTWTIKYTGGGILLVREIKRRSPASNMITDKKMKSVIRKYVWLSTSLTHSLSLSLIFKLQIILLASQLMSSPMFSLLYFSQLNTSHYSYSSYLVWTSTRSRAL